MSTSTTLPIFRLEFRAEAIKEWRKLDSSTKSQFEKKLRERLVHPRVVAARLRNLPDCYKIKLRKVGYRLIYRVDDDRVIVIVLAVGKRDRNEAYDDAANRMLDQLVARPGLPPWQDGHFRMCMSHPLAPYAAPHFSQCNSYARALT